MSRSQHILRFNKPEELFFEVDAGITFRKNIVDFKLHKSHTYESIDAFLKPAHVICTPTSQISLSNIKISWTFWNPKTMHAQRKQIAQWNTTKEVPVRLRDYWNNQLCICMNNSSHLCDHTLVLGPLFLTFNLQWTFLAVWT